MAQTIRIFFITAVATTVVISIISSQLVLADIQSFGLVVSFYDRLSMTVKDIMGLGPVLLLMISASFSIAFTIAKFAYRLIGGNRHIWFALAGFCSFPVTLLLIKYFMGVTLLASARTSAGMIFVACCCLFGGYLYAILTTRIKDVKKDV